jgi:hypothetical protein
MVSTSAASFLVSAAQLAVHQLTDRSITASSVELMAELLGRDRLRHAPTAHRVIQEHILALLIDCTTTSVLHSDSEQQWFAAVLKLAAAFRLSYLTSNQQEPLRRLATWISQHCPRFTSQLIEAANVFVTDATVECSVALLHAKRLGRAASLISIDEYQKLPFSTYFALCATAPPNWHAIVLLHAIAKQTHHKQSSRELVISPTQSWDGVAVISTVRSTIQLLIEAHDAEQLERLVSSMHLGIAPMIDLLQRMWPTLGDAKVALQTWLKAEVCKYFDAQAPERRISDDALATRTVALLGAWNAMQYIAVRDCTEARELLMGLVRTTCRAGVSSSLSEEFHKHKWRIVQDLVTYLVSPYQRQHECSASREHQDLLRIVFQHTLGGLESCSHAYVHHMLSTLSLLLHGSTSELDCSSQSVATTGSAVVLDGPLAISIEDFRDLLFSTWRSFDDSRNRNASTLSSFMQLCFAPSLLARLAQESSASTELGAAVKEALAHVAELASRSIRVAVCLLEHLCERVWKHNINVACWMLDEVVALCMYATGTFDGDTSAGGSAQLHSESSQQQQQQQQSSSTAIQSAALSTSSRADPRLVLLAFLEQLDVNVPENAQFVDCLLVALLRRNVDDPEFAQREYSTMTRTNRAKVNLWQTLCVLSTKSVAASTVDAVNLLLWDTMQLKNFGNIRYYIQVCAALACRLTIVAIG